MGADVERLTASLIPMMRPGVGGVSAASGASSELDGGGAFAADGGFTDHYTETVWQSAAASPQSLTIDLGTTYSGIDMLTYQPPQIAPQQVTKDTSGRITGYAISYSTDGTTFAPVTLKTGYDGSGQFIDSQLSGWRWAEFNAVRARYVRLQANSATGNDVKINEIDVGGRLVAPVAN